MNSVISISLAIKIEDLCVDCNSRQYKSHEFLILFYFCSFQSFDDVGDEKLSSPVLLIESMDRHKGGTYICTANNGVGQPASTQVVLHVLCK